MIWKKMEKEDLMNRPGIDGVNSNNTDILILVLDYTVYEGGFNRLV